MRLTSKPWKPTQEIVRKTIVLSGDYVRSLTLQKVTEGLVESNLAF
jgi:hypothetical protein